MWGGDALCCASPWPEGEGAWDQDGATHNTRRPLPTTSATPTPTGMEPLPLESGGLRTLASPMVGGMMRWQEMQHKNTLERCDGHKQLFSSSGGRRGET